MVKRRRKIRVLEVNQNATPPLPTKHGKVAKIDHLKEKYGDAVTLIQDIDRKPSSPGAWKDDYQRMVFWLALLNLTEVEMANIIGISEAGFQLWKRTHPEFLAAIQAGKEEASGAVANSLFQSAIGYSYDDVKIIPNRVKEYDENGRLTREHTEVLRVPIKKKSVPNVTAALKFLEAKHPEIWGNKIEHGGTIKHQHEVDVKVLTKKQLKALKKLKGVTPVD